MSELDGDRLEKAAEVEGRSLIGKASKVEAEIERRGPSKEWQETQSCDETAGDKMRFREWLMGCSEQVRGKTGLIGKRIQQSKGMGIYCHASRWH